MGGQRWELLNIDARSGYGGMGELSEVFFCQRWDDFARNLAEPVAVLEALPPLKNASTRKTEQVAVMGSSLGRFCLATELITMIFEEIDDIHDAVMLGLTHDTLMLIGWKHIRALALQDIAPWAGGRIICVGNWEEGLLEGLISEEEEEELFRLYSSTKQHYPTERFNLFNTSCWAFDHGTSSPRMKYQRLQGLSSKERQILCQIITKTGYQWAQGWVLMNLSAMEYVTSKSASRILHFMDPTDARCFGQLILSQICWSSDDSTYIDFNGPLHRGVWAGDRFRIVTTDVFKTRISGEEEEWMDVSVEAAKWLESILWGEGSDNEESDDEESDNGP